MATTKTKPNAPELSPHKKALKKLADGGLNACGEKPSKTAPKPVDEDHAKRIARRQAAITKAAKK